jgi:hypothetical protein
MRGANPRLSSDIVHPHLHVIAPQHHDFDGTSVRKKQEQDARDAVRFGHSYIMYSCVAQVQLRKSLGRLALLCMRDFRHWKRDSGASHTECTSPVIVSRYA